MAHKVIGIDPGVKTGFAVLLDGKLVRLNTLCFWGAYYATLEALPDLVVVELSRSGHVWHEKGVANGTRVAAATGRRIGSVMREAQLLDIGLTREGLNVETKHPQGKIDAAEFARVTGWQERTNEHTRDAGMLAWGAFYGRECLGYAQ